MTPTLLQDPFGAVWRFLASRKLTLALCVLLALAGLLMALFPQMPLGLQGDPLAYGRWLAQMRGRYGDSQDLLQRLGLFDVQGSLGLRILLGLLALHAAIHIAEGFSRLSGAMNGQHGANPLRVACIAEPDDQVRAALIRWAEGKGMRPQGPEGEWAGWQRFPWRGFWLLLPYVGILLALVGLAINGWSGWQEPELVITPGQEAVVGYDSGLTLVADTILAEGNATTQLTLYKHGEPVGQGRLRGRWPWLYQSYLLSQRAGGPAIVVRATDQDGEPVPVRSQPPRPAAGSGTELLFRDTGDEGYLLVSDLNVTFRLTYYSEIPEAGLAGPVINVQAIRSGEMLPAWEAWLEGDGNWGYQDIAFQVQHTRYAVITLSLVPGLPLMALGILLGLLGIIMTLASYPLYGLGLEKDGDGCQVILYHWPPRLGFLDRQRLHAVRQEIEALLAEQALS